VEPRQVLYRFPKAQPRAPGQLPRPLIFHGKRRPPRAQALIEFAFMLPITILLFLGIVDLGRAFYQAMAIREAAQAGALYAIVWQNVTTQCPTPCANTTTRSFIAAAPAGNGIVVDPIADIDLIPPEAWNVATGWQAGQAFTITVRHRFDFITPFLSNNQFLTLSTTINATRNP
jgi:Flp pilus assembly protein TadG